MQSISAKFQPYIIHGSPIIKILQYLINYSWIWPQKFFKSFFYTRNISANFQPYNIHGSLIIRILQYLINYSWVWPKSFSSHFFYTRNISAKFGSHSPSRFRDLIRRQKKTIQINHYGIRGRPPRLLGLQCCSFGTKWSHFSLSFYAL